MSQDINSITRQIQSIATLVNGQQALVVSNSPVLTAQLLQSMDSHAKTGMPAEVISSSAFAALPFTRRYPVGVMLGEAPLHEGFTEQLNRLKDLFCQQTLCLLNNEETDLRPYGFSRLDTENSPAHLWGFNYFDYKQRPEWLNSRFWANPENWDKYRW